ncbi:MAG: putative aminopeptidase FrvX [Candidatus Latescibacterota bacterium]|jgi:putative aminopeptidase FrvX
MPYPTDDPNVRLLTDLLAIPSPSGREEGMAAFIVDHISKLGHTAQQDAQGNVWVEIVGQDPDKGKLALASHMDELAMVITNICPDGTLSVRPSGGLHPWKLGECPVEIVCDGPATIGAHLCFGSTHTTDPSDPNTQFATGARGITWPHTYLVTGLTPDQLKEAGVRVGSTAVPVASVRGPHLFGPQDDPLLSAWILDNRGGTLTLLKLLERMIRMDQTPARTTCLCFMVQEESGLIGARGWSARNPVEIFIAVDSSPMPRNQQLTLDGRPAIWSKDSSMHFDQGLIQDLAKAAQKAGTEMQYAVYDRAASDASGVLDAGHAPRGATMGYPRENSHGYEIVRLSVFDNLIATLFEYLVN